MSKLGLIGFQRWQHALWGALLAAMLLLSGCGQPYVMGTAVDEMVAAQTATDVPEDSVGGSLTGIGDAVGEAYRGSVDSPDDVKSEPGDAFILVQ